jgi:hypothetical protein
MLQACLLITSTYHHYTIVFFLQGKGEASQEFGMELMPCVCVCDCNLFCAYEMRTNKLHLCRNMIRRTNDDMTIWPVQGIYLMA